MKIRYVLAALLTFAVLTLWVGERWALSGVEICAYLAACAVIVVQRGRIQIGVTLLAPVLMCAWAAIQWTAHWSAVPSATADSCLYWLAAACFVLLGSQVDRETFLKTALAIGAAVCVAGTIQLFTSHGNVFWLFPSGFDRRVIGPFVSPNNYAAFVELLIPIALTRGLTPSKHSWRTHSCVQRSHSCERVLGLHEGAGNIEIKAQTASLSTTLPYLLIAAALAATVVASGSRAGAALVLAEIVVVFALQSWNRKALLAFALLTAAFTLIAGQQFLSARFSQSVDPFGGRREFLQSSLAMFRAEPLHGFGLGTWPSAYPQFALIDTGEVANHAHNEWAQWAAEGGIPALAITLGLLFWTVRPALRSVWAIGILAVFAHSLVDYPFLRLGLAAWIFAFLGVLSSSERFRRTLPAFAVVPVLLFGAWQAGKLAYADALYHRATPSSVERAATMAPDRGDYQFVLAQLDSSHAAAHLERALAANPYDTRARIGLAFEREASGDPSAAARQLLEAARYDHQFAPAWALAGFYLRNGEPDRFWTWAQKSAAMSYGNRRAFFDLCFLATDDAHQVFEKVVAPRQDLDLPFLEYLIARHRIRDAAEVAGRIAHDRSPTARDELLDYIDAAIDAGETAQAWRVRNQFPANGPNPVLVNGDFAGPLLNRAFDWKIPATDGVIVARTQDSGPAVAIEFSGREPESCELLNHTLALEAGAMYVMRFDYRTVQLAAHTGISWVLGAGRVPLDASVGWKTEEWRFRATGPGNLVLTYRRSPGSTRAEGRLFLRKAQIDAAPL
jgi:O-antigen ligase